MIAGRGGAGAEDDSWLVPTLRAEWVSGKGVPVPLRTRCNPFGVIDFARRILSSMAIALASHFRLEVPVSLRLCLLLCLAWPGGLVAADHEALKADAEQFFRSRVTPFINTYCLQCHQNRRPTRGGVNFSPALKAPGHAAFTDQWKRADARVKAHDMPPQNMRQPDEADRRMFSEWLTKLKYLSDKDPGPFVIRRLTKTEYGNTLRDLFGVDPAVADGLPSEVSGQGYMNSLSSLQLEQYLAIADQVLAQMAAAMGKTASAVLRLSTCFWARVRLSMMLRCGNSSKCWNTMPTRLRSLGRLVAGSVICTPSTVMLPFCTGSRPLTVLMRVDFPEPEGPHTTTTSPLLCSPSNRSAPAPGRTTWKCS